MRKVILTLALVATLGIVACSSDKKKDHENEHSKEIAKVEYHCPMKCEGDKTYAEKNKKCPVCKMNLVEVEKTSDDDKMKEHDSDENHEHDTDSDGKNKNHENNHDN